MDLDVLHVERWVLLIQNARGVEKCGVRENVE